MIQKCEFNPLCDVEETVPELSANISEMMQSHVVPPTNSEGTYSNESDVKDVGQYLRDKVDIAMAAMRLNKSMSQVNQAVTPAVQPKSE